MSISLMCFSAVSPNGLNEKYTTVQASGDVLSLLRLENGCLAAGTDTSTIDAAAPERRLSRSHCGCRDCIVQPGCGNAETMTLISKE